MSSSSRPGDDHGSLVRDLGLERRAQRELHVRGGEMEPAGLRPQQDPEQHLHGRARRDGAANDARAALRAPNGCIVAFSPVPTTMSVSIMFLKVLYS